MSTTHKAGSYLDMQVLPTTATADNPTLVICWYDSVNKNLVLSWDAPKNTDTKAADGMVTGNWATNAATVSTKGGMYCRMAIDEDNGIHIVHYDNTGADLLYTYVPVTNAVPQPASAQTFMIDSYLSVGTYCTIDVAKVSNGNGGYNHVPYIGYFVPANQDTSASTKQAKPIEFNEDGYPLFNGVEDDKYTSKWEVTIVPTNKIPIMDRVNVGVYKTTINNVKGVLTAIPTGNRVDEAETNTFPVSNSTRVFGNGTTNPIVVYPLDDGPIEMAQKK